MAEGKKKKGKLTAAALAIYGITPKQTGAQPHFGRPWEAISPVIFLAAKSHAELMEQRVVHQQAAESLER